MSCLLDTSVWSEALRRKNTSLKSEKTFLYHLIQNEENIFITGVIIQELLSGIKNEKMFMELKEILLNFEIIEPDVEDYIQAASLQNKISAKGIQASTVDLLLVSIAIRRNYYLLSFDKDFNYISKHTDLRLLSFESYLKMK
ncbi:MAG: PIN domain-containing protein [Leptospiraceae bacterium]|nr:PIN domain-containing protein [Leptospiraceae bacterium]